MKIVIPLISFGKQGGFRVLSELANNWLRHHHEVVFLVYKRSGVPYFPTNANIVWFDNDGELCDNNDVSYNKPILRIFGVLYALFNALNRINCDIILANECLTAYPVYFSSHKRGKKFYYIQAYEPDFYLGLSFSKIILRCLSKASYFLKFNRIVNSPIYFDYKGIKADRVVYPGIDFDIFKPLQKNRKSPFILGCIGRMEPYKGTAFVIEAFKILRKEFKENIELHIAFGDPDWEKIDGIKVIRINGDQELAKYYNRIDTIVAPGTIQLGAVHYPVIEAMACKTPVITTGYYPADNSNSIIVPIRDYYAIYNAVVNIINNQDEALNRVELAYSKVEEFRWITVSDKMLIYFSQVL